MTLELALAGVPTVAAYRVTLIEEIIARLAGLQQALTSVILANLVIGENVVPEFLQRDCTPQRLADALVPLVFRYAGAVAADRGLRAARSASWRSMRAPSAKAAAIVLDVAPAWPPRSRRRHPAKLMAYCQRRAMQWPNHPAIWKRRDRAIPTSRANDEEVQQAKIVGPRRDHRRARLRAARLLTNAELARMVDTSDQWIVERTGIKERHILKGKGLGTSHMGAEAVRGLLKKTGTAPGDVDLLICATTTPDFVFPSTANLICDMADIRNIGSFDVQAACSGFVYALTIAAQFIETGHLSQDRGGRRRQDVGDHRLYRPRHLRAVRRRRRRRASRAEPKIRHHRHADLPPMAPA